MADKEEEKKEDDSKKEDSDKDSKKEESKSNVTGEKIAAAAKALLQKQLKYNAQGGDGEKDTNNGMFIYTVFKAIGNDVQSKKIDEQYLYMGRNGGTLFETISAAIAGDVVFYKPETKETTAESCGVTDAAIYMSDNKIIRIDTSAGIKEDKLEYNDKVKGKFIFCRYANSENLPSDVKKETLPQKASGTSNQGDTGFKVRPVDNEHVHITKLPEKKTYCEPIYPDYVCVSDTVPAWALSEADAAQQDVASAVLPDETGGTDAPEVAPNGKHYLEEEIKALMDKDPNLTREQAIAKLATQEKYTKNIQDDSSKKESDTDKSATMPGDKEDDNHSHGQAPNGKYYSNNDWDYLKSKSLTDVQIKAVLDISDAYRKS